MKKFLSCMVLMMVALTVSAMAQMKAHAPDAEQDIGHYEVATISVDGQAVASFDSQYNIVDLQTPVMLNMEVSQPSAQVVDAVSAQTPTGEVSMTLASYRWPTGKTEAMNHRNDHTYNYAPPGADPYDSFTAQRADTY